MTKSAEMPGQPTGGKAINLGQLEQELRDASVQVEGLGMADDQIFVYDGGGRPTDFVVELQPIVDQAIVNHVALRPKTSQEYAAEFQDSSTTVARKQEIRDIQNELLPPEMVPYDWVYEG